MSIVVLCPFNTSNNHLGNFKKFPSLGLTLRYCNVIALGWALFFFFFFARSISRTTKIGQSLTDA